MYKTHALRTVACVCLGVSIWTSGRASWGGEPGSALGIPLHNSNWFQLTPGDRVPVCLANYRGAQYFAASNSMLRLVNVPQGKSSLVSPAFGIAVWNPTGLAFNKQRQLLYVANYTGHDVLVMRMDSKRQLQLVRRITHPQLKGPIGVATNRDGTRIAVADYTGNAVFLFQEDGTYSWHKPLQMPHGICMAHDQNSVIATSLFSRQLVRYSVDGQRLQQHGAQGWAENEYLWPTGIQKMSGQRYVVADAHTGQLSVLNSQLDEIKTIGGNGPGLGLFNMPYHAIETPNGDLIVADTYKNRIVQIDWEHEQVISALYCSGSSSIRKGREMNRRPYLPLGRGYVSYVNRQQDVHLGRFVPGLAEDNWHVAYNAINGPGSRVTMEGPSQIVGFDSYYFVQAAQVALPDGTNCLVVGSPQRPRWLVIKDGVFATLPLQNNLWIAGDQLAGDFASYPLQRIAQHGMVKIRNYKGSTLADPFERVGKTLFADVTYETFKSSLHQFFVSQPGKQLHQELLDGKPNFDAYYAAIRLETSVPLLEYCFVNAMRGVWR